MNTLTVNGVELAFVDRGCGAPLLLVHGFPLDHTMWNAQIDALSLARRVIAPDLRGFGRSGVTDALVTMEQLADDLDALLAAIEVPEPVALCGLSMGGYVAFQFWRRHRARLCALILADTRAMNDSPEMAAARLAMADRVIREGPAPLVDNMTPRLFAEATSQNRDDLVESLRQMMLATDPRGIAAASRGMARRPDMTPMLGQIDCPTLVVVGEQDAISPPGEMRELARAIPRARFAEIPNCGHMSPMEKPAEFNEAIEEFLAALETESGGSGTPDWCLHGE
ncbi:MAG: alpha/beta fold hydrolase [Pirellulales bacterium]|nr:alpha/beta fold hydrolase [Pirellulales bacterium]